MKRQSRIRRLLAFTSTLLGAFMILSVAAAIAVGSTPDPGSTNNDPPQCTSPAYLGQNQRVCLVDVCNPSGNGKTITIDNEAYLNGGFQLPPCATDDGEEECPPGECEEACAFDSSLLASDPNCKAPDPDPVDACPDVAGFQQAGPCDTPGSSDTTPTPTDTTGGGDQGEQVPAGEVPDYESLTIEDAVEDHPATVGDEEIVAGAAAGGGATDAGTTVTPTGSLPYTGGPLELVAALGTALVLFGMAGIAIGRRADRRRAAAAA